MKLMKRNLLRGRLHFAAVSFLALLLSACVAQTRTFAVPDDAVASVNGSKITAKELESAIDRLIPRSSFHGKVTEERRSEFRDKALENLINAELQYQDALARGIKVDKKPVRAQMNQIRERFKSKKEYRVALERAGITDDQLRLRVEKQVVISTAIENIVTEPAKASEADLENYYNKNIEKFEQPEAMRLRVISVSDEAKAKEALVRLEAGEEFATVAETTSEDDYRTAGGDIGYIQRGRIYPELEDLAVEMEPGEKRGPVAAQGKWFIIKLEDRKTARRLSYEESREKLKSELEKERADERMETWIASLRARAIIEVLNQN